jgi:hypothetical protein
MNGKRRKTPIGTQQVRHTKAARAHISQPRLDLRARRDPAQERSRQTVDAIVEAAGQLLVEHGRPRSTLSNFWPPSLACYGVYSRRCSPGIGWGD